MRPRTQRISDPIDPSRVDEILAEVERGASYVVAVRPDDASGVLAGCRTAHRLPYGEWFVTLADRPEATRLDGEFAVAGPLTLLFPETGTETAATTSIEYRHHPTVTVRSYGAGRVVGCGFGDLAAAMDHPMLGSLLDRLARSDLPSTSAELGVGVVGYGPFGGMGYLHGLAATETDGLALVAAADAAPERIEAARIDFPDLRGHASADELAADPDVDIAIIATPPVLHAELARTLLRAGKHVVVEKPMCLDPADADGLIAVAAEHERVLTVHQSRRWDTDWLALRRVIGRGDIGEVFNLETFVGGFEHPCRAWHSEESISGGAVYDWGSHHIDWIIQQYGSAPTKVLCSTHTRVWLDTTNVDQLAVWMQWPDGREATFRQSDVCAIRRPKFHVQGTAGTIEGHYAPVRTDAIEPGRGFRAGESHHAERPVDLRVVRYDGDHGLIDAAVPPAPHPGWGFHRNLADHLLLGEPLAVRPEQSRDVVAVLEAAHRSGSKGGELVELP